MHCQLDGLGLLGAEYSAVQVYASKLQSLCLAKWSWSRRSGLFSKNFSLYKLSLERYKMNTDKISEYSGTMSTHCTHVFVM